MTNLTKFTKAQVQQFLRDRGRSVTGTKTKLVKLCETYKDVAVTNTIEKDHKVLVQVRKVFDDPDLNWTNILLKKPHPSKGFGLRKVEDFLTSAVMISEDGDETDVCTSKPSIRGRKLYASSRFRLVEFFLQCQKDDIHLYRSITGASLKCNHPCAALTADNDIKITKCTTG